MLPQLALGLLMTAITICCGVLTIVTSAELLRQNKDRFFDQGRFHDHLIVLAMVSTWLVTGILFVTLIWAWLLQWLGVFSDFDVSLYFSIISFTTVGYGDVVPPEDWRLLSAFVSVGGFLLFGLNTAFVFEVLRQMRGDRSLRHNSRG